MAAQAVSLQENTALAIFSATTEPSKLGGAQFLHKPILQVNDHTKPDTVIKYRVRGDEETYRKKVYGDTEVPFTSFSQVKDGQTQPAWNLIETYERLWDKFAEHITPGPINAAWFDNPWVADFTHIFSSIPLPAICKANAGVIPEFHHFKTQEVHICVDRFGECPPDTIVYDGTDEHRFYRQSLIFGTPGTEWATKPPPISGIVKDSKPISTSCNCHPDVIRVGRRGTWTKGVLTHDAFTAVWKELAGG